MRKFLIIVGILLVLVILFLIFGRKYYTKRFSPEDHAELVDGNFEALVFYNRPFKRGREIFGGLVPYGKVWRTGANEATWFETNKTISIQGKMLKPGRYSLWTIPNETSWQVILNSTIPPWGIDYNSEAARNPDTDVLVVNVPVSSTDVAVEQFTIVLSKENNGFALDFLWDKTDVKVPFTVDSPEDK
jgi:hypothetical protein